jgi:hypothetical protein
MDNLKIYCMCLQNTNLEIIKNLNYIPVGLKNNDFSKEWLRDNTKENISKKNPFYGEYTFHYWLWKNNFLNHNFEEWIGFCTYRRFWSKSKPKKKHFNLIDNVINKVPDEWKEYDSVLVEPIYINITKLSKILKHGKKQVIKNPFIFFNKNKITIKVHFDMYHGHGNLDKAIDLLETHEREKFRNFVKTEIAFNPYNMFICRSKKILFNYYSSIFPWLEKCEHVFGFDMNDSYGEKRIYGFLAERYLSFWFKKYTNYLEWPVIYYDINK